MKKLVQALFILFSVAALGVAVYYFIEARAAAAEANRSLAMRKLVLGSEQGSVESQSGRSDASLNRVAALPNEVVLDTLAINLDQDEVDEQILTVRKTDGGKDRISIVVADYSLLRKAWVRAFEGETLATKFTTFQIHAEDLSGDHNLDIVATGMGEASEQTMTLFHRVKGAEAEVVAYAPACAISADSIAIGRLERSEGYQLGQTNGVSWPIYSYRRDKGSENILDQVKTTWTWDFKSAAYVESGTEKIPGVLVEKEMAERVLTGVETDFENFLVGAWTETGKADFDPTARILVFDPAAKSIIFYSPDAQEDFDWNESQSTRYGLYVNCQNESVTSLRRLMDIALTGPDTISVRIFEDLQMKVDTQDVWDGTYRKMPASSGLDLPAAKSAATAPRLDGSWRGKGGASLVLEKQRFTLQDGETVRKGSFLVYALGQDLVLQLIFLQDSGLASERRTYRLGYSETKTGKKTTRHMSLSPARTTIEGLELLQEAELSFDSP